MRDDRRLQTGEDLDSRIDAALRSYLEPPETTEPRIVLARILERARDEQPRHRGWWIWGTAGAAACLAALVPVVWLLQAPPSPQIAWEPPAPAVVTAPSVEVARSPAPALRRSAQARPSSASREVASHTAPLPKLDVFPTPQPLTPEEEALVAFAKHGPPEVQRAVIEDQKHWDDPIIVAELVEKSPQPPHQQDR